MSAHQPRAFVIMPFNEHFDVIYNDFIKPVLEKNRFLVERADEIQGSQNIQRGIVGGIYNSELIVADLTEHNPNVYYELGLVHGLRKKLFFLHRM